MLPNDFEPYCIIIEAGLHCLYNISNFVILPAGFKKLGSTFVIFTPAQQTPKLS